PSLANGDTVTDGVQRSSNSGLQEQQLQPLLTKERALVQQYGPDHPEVRSIRAQIDAIREFIGRPPSAPAKSESPSPTPRTVSSSSPLRDSKPALEPKRDTLVAAASAPKAEAAKASTAAPLTPAAKETEPVAVATPPAPPANTLPAAPEHAIPEPPSGLAPAALQFFPHLAALRVIILVR